MTIAAVIPTYNAAAFIEDTLASVFAQTLQPDEVIVVDDCSTDDTAAIARRLGATVIVLEKNSGGPAVPLNTGIAAAKSEWIATLDHDDRWRPDWLNLATAAAKHARVNFVFGNVLAVPTNSELQTDLDEIGTYFKKQYQTLGNDTYRIPNVDAYRFLVEGLSFVVTCSNIVFTKRLGQQIKFDANITRSCDYRFVQQVTFHEDIAYVDTNSSEWVNSPASLYQQGNMDRLDRDLIYVYKHFGRSRLNVVADTCLRLSCRKTANDLAYAARNRGEYRRAFLDYCDSLRYGGANRTALLGILKLPLAMLRGKRP